jgi:hypothetical protein
VRKAGKWENEICEKRKRMREREENNRKGKYHRECILRKRWRKGGSEKGRRMRFVRKARK